MFKHFQYGIAVLLLVVLSQSCSREAKKENQVAARFYAVEETWGEKPNFQADLSKRKVFPFSVVPGGTITKEEVKAKVACDATVREHYKGIDFDKLKPYRLTRPAMGYVSYRIGNKIYWTAQRLYLKAGEVLLSDGVSIIRGRCGNRVSLVAMDPVLHKAEPSEAVMDLPSWDAPVFQAMVREANSLDGGLPFGLSAQLPPTFVALQRDLPSSYFPVAPPAGLTGPGSIGGGLPTGIVSGNPSETIVLTNQPPIIYVGGTPTNPNYPISIPTIMPIEIAYNFPPSVFYSGQPIGTGSPTLFVEVPFTPSLQFPPQRPPNFPVDPNQPPIVLPPTNVVVEQPIVIPPGVGTPPTKPPDLIPPTEPISLIPPETVTPPVEPVPEPGTLVLVSAAAALIYLYRRAAAAKAGS